MKKLMVLLMLLYSVALTANIPSGIILTDKDGNSYDFDAILASGKSIIVHKTSAT